MIELRQSLTHVALLLSSLLIVSCSGSSVSSQTAPVMSGPGLRYLALGDSYTIGESVSPSDRWPVQLANLLRSEGLKVGLPEIIAKTGWTTDELDRAITEANPQGPYDLVTLLIGVNNQYRGRDAEQFRREFVGLLERSVGLAGGRRSGVVVLAIPDWGVTPFAEGRDRQKIASELDRFNAIAREESDRKGVAFVDIAPFSRGAASDLSLVADDRLHPSSKMYAEWARLALNQARRAITAK